MPIIKIDPIEDFEAIQEIMTCSFEEILLGKTPDSGTDSRWVPAIDVYETETAIIVHAELPGMKPDDVEIVVHGASLVLRGTRSFPRAETPENYYRIERAYGKFERFFTLPDSSDMKNIAATFTDGVLTLTIPKRTQNISRVIKISTE